MQSVKLLLSRLPADPPWQLKGQENITVVSWVGWVPGALGPKPQVSIYLHSTSKTTCQALQFCITLTSVCCFQGSAWWEGSLEEFWMSALTRQSWVISPLRPGVNPSTLHVKSSSSGKCIPRHPTLSTERTHLRLSLVSHPLSRWQVACQKWVS